MSCLKVGDVDARCTAKHLNGRLSRHETMASKRTQLTDRGAVAADDERQPLIESPHDPPTVIAKLSLGTVLGHGPIVALRATPVGDCPPKHDPRR